MKTQRDAFFDALYNIAFRDKDVILVSADMGAPSLDKFRRDLAYQYVDVGIAEQQAVLVATGLALGGIKAFVYGIGPFVTYRCFEQIRLDLAAMNVPVTIIGVGAGMSYEESGPTHHTTEDLSCLRTLPNFFINNCSDSVMAEAMVQYSLDLVHPNYVRLDRKPFPSLYQPGHDFSKGMEVLRPGDSLFIVATGNMVHTALALAVELETHGLQVGVIDVYRFPIHAENFCEKISTAKFLFSMEEHTLPGGLGSAVAEVIADRCLGIPLKRFGCDFRHGFCYTYGGRKRMQESYGLNPSAICEMILKLTKYNSEG
jgi:transketolase